MMENHMGLTQTVYTFLKMKEALVSKGKILTSSSSFTGLFWFSEDYSEVTETQGVVEFTDSDVINKNTVLPEGAHSVYKTSRFRTPRGRVELEKGVPVISVGDKCPESTINDIIKYMGLSRYKGKVEVRRNSFWDMKK